MQETPASHRTAAASGGGRSNDSLSDCRWFPPDECKKMLLALVLPGVPPQEEELQEDSDICRFLEARV